MSELRDFLWMWSTQPSVPRLTFTAKLPIYVQFPDWKTHFLCFVTNFHASSKLSVSSEYSASFQAMYSFISFWISNLGGKWNKSYKKMYHEPLGEGGTLSRVPVAAAQIGRLWFSSVKTGSCSCNIWCVCIYVTSSLSHVSISSISSPSDNNKGLLQQQQQQLAPKGL